MHCVVKLIIVGVVKINFQAKEHKKNSDILNQRTYKRCLNTSETITCENSGFRFIDKTMKTYTQDKIGLNPIYVKGVVMNDGYHIHPLII